MFASVALSTVLLATAPEAVDEWSLWSDGPKLRGANIYQRRRYDFDGAEFLGSGPIGPPYTQQDFDRLAALGANAVFLSHPGLFAENPPYVVEPDAQSNLDAKIAMAVRASLYVVIGFRTGPGRSEATFGYFPNSSYDNEKVWTDPQAQDAWSEMWRYTAQRYRNAPSVIGYELMVEPNSNDRLLQIFEPGDFYPRHAGSLYDWNALYPRILQSIRQVDSDTPVLVGGMNFSSIDWLPYLFVSTDPRTLHTVHFYEPFVYTHQDPSRLTLTYPGTFDPGSGAVETVNQQWLQRRLGAIETFRSNHPGRLVAITEFGVQRWEPGAAGYFADVTALFEQMRINHFFWVWASSWPPFTIADEFDVRHGPDPNVHSDVASALLDAVRTDMARNIAVPITRPKRRAARH